MTHTNTSEVGLLEYLTGVKEDEDAQVGAVKKYYSPETGLMEHINDLCAKDPARIKEWDDEVDANKKRAEEGRPGKIPPESHNKAKVDAEKAWKELQRACRGSN